MERRRFDHSRIKKIREYRGCSQMDVAKILYMSQVSYHNLENGKACVKADTLYDLSQCFGIDIRFFYDNGLTVEQWLAKEDEKKQLKAMLAEGVREKFAMQQQISSLQDKMDALERLVATKEDLLATERYRIKRKDNTIVIILFCCMLYIYYQIFIMLFNSGLI